MGDFLSRTVLENRVSDVLWFAGIVLAGLLLHRFLSRILSQLVFHLLKNYSKGLPFEKLFELVKKPFGIFILLITFCVAFSKLSFPKSWDMAPEEIFGVRMFIIRGYYIAIIISVTWIVLRIVDFFGLILIHRSRSSAEKTEVQLVPFITESIKLTVGIFSFFFILGGVFQLNIASIIAGLGIGGLAVALAAKESIENLLSSFTIFLDKPFSVGDSVKIGNISGEVEKIGFRSTRIRTVEKNFVTVPNKKMVEAELENISLRTHQRAKFDIALSPETSSEKIKSIIAGITKLLSEHPRIVHTESRVKFFELNNHSMNVMILYFVDSPDNDIYLDVREEINFLIFEVLQLHGVKLSPAVNQIIIQK